MGEFGMENGKRRVGMKRLMWAGASAIAVLAFSGCDEREAPAGRPEEKQAPQPFLSEIEQKGIQHLRTVADMHNRRDAFSVAGTLAEGCLILQIGDQGKVVSSNAVNRQEYAARLSDYFNSKPDYTYTCYPIDIQPDGNGINVRMDVLETWTADGKPVRSGSRQAISFVPDASGRLLARSISYQPVAVTQAEASTKK